MATIINFLYKVWDWLTGYYDNITSVLLWVPKKLFSELVDACVAALNAIPVPGWLDSVGGLWAGIPSGVWWFASVAQFGFGMAVIGSALTLRFIIRRLPIIG